MAGVWKAWPASGLPCICVFKATSGLSYITCSRQQVAAGTHPHSEFFKPVLPMSPGPSGCGLPSEPHGEYFYDRIPTVQGRQLSTSGSCALGDGGQSTELWLGWLWSLLPLLCTQICNGQDTRTKIPPARGFNTKEVYFFLMVQSKNTRFGKTRHQDIRSPAPGSSGLCRVQQGPWSSWSRMAAAASATSPAFGPGPRRGERGAHIAPLLVRPGARTAVCSHPTARWDLRRRMPSRS